MRHHNAQRKFGRKANVRRGFLRSLAVNLIDRGRIRTTEARAKELRKFVEPLVTKARANTLASRRLVAKEIGSGETLKHLFNEVAPKYKERPGGYTRITKLPQRDGDAAKMAVIEFV